MQCRAAFVVSLLLTCAFLISAAPGDAGQRRRVANRGYPAIFPLATAYVPFRPSCKRGRFPFIASIKYVPSLVGGSHEGCRDRTLSRKHICGGVLISENAVLTAAHCVDPRSSRLAVVYPEVHVGAENLAYPVEKFQTVLAIPHPEWTGDLRDGYDLVILKLDRSACLAPISTLGHQKRIRNGFDYEFLGYGRSGDAGAFSAVLQKGAFSKVTNQDCSDLGVTLRENEFCFSSDGDVGACTGDDGGPLVVPPVGFFGLYEELIGIASYTTGSCGEQGATVFMKLDSFKDWIQTTLDSEEFKMAS